MPSGHRHTIRYRGFDYSGPGAYFVTMRVHEQCIGLCRVVGEHVELNRFGGIVERWWRALPERFMGITLDAYVVMPDHFHGIIVIDHPRPLEVRSTLGQMIAWFKYNSTKEINALLGTAARRRWQRNYWEHIIRDERAWENIRRYIRENPARWAMRDGESRG